MDLLHLFWHDLHMNNCKFYFGATLTSMICSYKFAIITGDRQAVWICITNTPSSTNLHSSTSSNTPNGQSPESDLLASVLPWWSPRSPWSPWWWWWWGWPQRAAALVRQACNPRVRTILKLEGEPSSRTWPSSFSLLLLWSWGQDIVPIWSYTPQTPPCWSCPRIMLKCVVFFSPFSSLDW